MSRETLSKIFLGLFIFLAKAHALIFPPENRVEFFELRNEKMREASSAVAAMVYQNMLQYHPKLRRYLISGPSFQERHQTCENNPLNQRPAPVLCTGFLVGEKTLITAGHCMLNHYDCANNLWVFDFATQYQEQSHYSVSDHSVYRCRQVLDVQWDPKQKIDYAIVELDRPVLGRRPLALGSGGPQVGEALFMPGHGGGLPLRITTHGEVLSNHHPSFFSASLDALGGNSGSPIINSYTMEVEGILVRGGGAPEWKEIFLQQTKSKKPGFCREEYVCDENCAGVEGTRISELFNSLNQIPEL